MTENIPDQSAAYQQVVLDKLDLILTRMDTIEARMDCVEATVAEMPGIAATAVNTVDAYFSDHADTASELGKKVPQALDLLEKLAASNLLDRLNHIADRVEQFEPWLAMLADAPGMAVSGIDASDEYLNSKAETFSRLVEQMPRWVGILETLTESDLLRSLEKLAAHTDDFTPWLNMLTDMPGALITAVDSFDELVAHYKSNGVDILERGHQLLELTLQVTEPKNLLIFKELLAQRHSLQMLIALLRDMPGIVSMAADTTDEFWRQYAPEGDQIDAMLSDFRQGIFDPAAISVVASAGRAMAESAHNPSSAGPLQLLKSLREPEFRRAMGFLLTFVRDFSQRLDHAHIQKSTIKNGRN